MISDLHLRTNFKNPDIDILISKPIIEYDIKAAGFNIAKELGLLSKSEISKLENFDKLKRHIYLGEKERKSAKYKELIMKGFANVRLNFIKENGLEYNDIISIKNDAFFVKKECNNLEFGKYIKFIAKNRYSSYLRIDRRVEFYYSAHKENTDVKGIDEEKLNLHSEYFMDFINRYFEYFETRPDNIFKFLRIFFDDYLSRNLDVNYYRTFDYRSIIEIYRDDISFSVDNWPEDSKEEIDIKYNYQNVLLPLLKFTAMYRG